MTSALDLLSGVFLGPEDQQPQDQSFLQGVGSTLQKLPETIGSAVGMSSFGGEVGQGYNTLSDILGQDVGSGTKLEGWQKALPLAALGGAGLLGAMHLGGVPLWHLTRPSQWAADLHSDRGAVGFGEHGLTEATPPIMPQVQAPKIPEDLLWGTVHPNTARFLQISGDPTVGWDDLTRAALDRGIKSDTTEPVHMQTSAFLRATGQRLVDEVPSHMMSTQVHQFPEQAPLAAMAFEAARFDAANRLNGGKSILRGDVLKRAARSWNDLRQGESIPVADMQHLQDTMVKFSTGLQFVAHPELALYPTVGLVGLNADAGALAVTLKSLHFDQVGWGDLGSKEFNDRLNQMFQLNPAAMVDPMRANITDFIRQQVQPDAIVQGREWYPKAKADLTAAARDNGLDANRLIVHAAILSGGENWSTNIPKAVTAAQAIDRAASAPIAARAGAFDALHESLLAQGLKASRADVMRALLVYGLDNPSDFFTTGKRVGGDTYARLIDRFEAGEPLAKLVRDRRLPEAWKSQKQFAFDAAINASEPSDVEDQMRYLNELMQGRVPLQDAREQLPVVVDRQAIKVALGVGIDPDTFPIDNKGVYDSIARAYAISAAEIGQLDGEPLTPLQAQAIPWVEYRRRTNVVKPDLTDFAPQERTTGQQPARWYEGKKPIVFNERVANMVMKSPPAPFNLGEFIGDGTDRARPEELNGFRGAASAGRDVTVTMNGDGTFRVHADEQAPPETFRGFSPTRHFDEAGRQMLVPSEAYLVDHVDGEVARFGNATKMAWDAENVWPWKRPGHWLTIAPMEFRDDRGSVIQTAKGASDQFQAELSRRGIVPKTVEVGHPMTGVTTEWGDEVRVPTFMEFASAQDRNAAAEMLNEPGSNPKIAPRVADEIFPENKDMKTGKVWVDVAPTFIHANGPHEAPVGTVRAWETHFKDAAGNYGLVLTRNGDAVRSSPIYVDAGFYDYLDDHPRLDPGKAVHGFVNSEGRIVLDGQIQVVDNPDVKLTTPKSASGFWGAKVNGRAPERATLYMPDGQMAQVMYGSGESAAQGALPGTSGLEGTDPSKTAIVIRHGTRSVEVQLPVEGGESSVLFSWRVSNLLRRTGVTANITFSPLEP